MGRPRGPPLRNPTTRQLVHVEPEAGADLVLVEVADLDRRGDVWLQANLRPTDMKKAVVYVDGEEGREVIGHTGHGRGGKLYVGGPIACRYGYVRDRVCIIAIPRDLIDGEADAAAEIRRPRRAGTKIIVG